MKERWLYKVALLVFAIACFYFRNKLATTQEDYEIAKTENGRMAQMLENYSFDIETGRREIDLLKTESVLKYQMLPTPIDSTGLSISIYQIPNNGKVYVIVKKPFALDRQLQFKLWGTREGIDFEAGSFNVGLTGLQQSIILPIMDSFKITIEQMGKVVAPTKAPILISKKIGC